MPYPDISSIIDPIQWTEVLPLRGARDQALRSVQHLEALARPVLQGWLPLNTTQNYKRYVLVTWLCSKGPGDGSWIFYACDVCVCVMFFHVPFLEARVGQAVVRWTKFISSSSLWLLDSLAGWYFWDPKSRLFGPRNVCPHPANTDCWRRILIIITIGSFLIRHWNSRTRHHGFFSLLIWDFFSWLVHQPGKSDVSPQLIIWATGKMQYNKTRSIEGRYRFWEFAVSVYMVWCTMQ